MTNFTPFDVADYLDNEEMIAAYLTGALEDPDPNAFLVAVKTVARSRGMTQLAKDTGLGRTSLYKALSPGSKPRYETVMKVVRALGVNLHAEISHT
ncbi:MAG: putative addiction module antidote protein [Desulfobacterales bacterium]|nr:putative addiction module antidote protein [Desulfobacterales bacterium]